MKCPADLVFACDEEPQCDCGFCYEHCICSGDIFFEGDGDE